MNRRLRHLVIPIFLLLSVMLPASAQEPDASFYFGVDLSYVNEMEDCGAVYREKGEERDPFALFAEHGANLVRARLWHNPDWTDYSTLEDVKRTFARARDAGMSTLLDIHYSDNWADAGTQAIPAGWQDMDDQQLAVAVYEYTADVLRALAAENLTPAFVQIGNETNSGILKRGGEQNWPRDAALFNAGIQAVRDFAADTETNPQIVLHVAQPENTGWWFTEAEAADITDFDVIGVSYYPQWSTFSIADMGAQVSYLRGRFGKQVMVLEAAYAWTRDAVQESADNILDQGLRGYPFSPEGQHRFIADLTQSLISNGASGVVYWEPAWVSTSCSTRWGQGSHWENATFFDFQNGNEVLPAMQFLRDDYLHPASLPDAVIDDSYGSAFVEDEAGDVPNNSRPLDLSELYIIDDGSTLALALVIQGNIFEKEGSYLVYLDTTQDAQGAGVDVGQRPIVVADPYKPEFRLDVSIQEERGTTGGRYTLNRWIGDDWEAVTFTGGAAMLSGEPSIIEINLPLVLIQNPEVVNIAVVSTDRGRARGASDVLGLPLMGEDALEMLTLDQFFEYRLQ